MNAVRNAPCNTVTHAAQSGVRGCVQNQNQNQTVLKAGCGWSVDDVAFIHQAVDARAAMNEQKP